MSTKTQMRTKPGTEAFGCKPLICLLERSEGDFGRQRVRITSGKSFSEKEANQNNNREESRAPGRKPSHSPFVRSSRHARGPSSTGAPLITGLPCRSAIFSAARTLQCHFTNTNIVQVITGGEYTNRLRLYLYLYLYENFGRKQYIGRIHYRSSNKGPYVSLFLVESTDCL